MDDILETTLLFDFYGQLLTEKQREVFEMYYQNDLSLGEIAETFDISRQGVRDSIKKTEKILKSYEERLNLLVKFQNINFKIDKALSLLHEMEETENFIEIKNLLYEVKENS